MARRGDHSREEIRNMAMEAAEKIVMEQGHNKLTARKVAQEIGYAVGTLYLVFDNLDNLILHINARTLDRIYQAMTDIQVQNMTGEDRLIRLGQIYISFAYADPHRWALIFEHHLPDEQSLPEWFSEKITRVFAVVEDELRPLAPHLSETEIEEASRALWAGIHGVCILGITQKLDSANEEYVLNLARSLMVNYLSGFMIHQN